MSIDTSLWGLLGPTQAERRARQSEANATREEAEREARIKRSTAAIDAIFDSPQRQQQYMDFVSALRAYQGERLDRGKADADRGLKFSLARSGLAGGSVAVDRGRRLGEEYSDAVLGAERKTQGALSDLMTADERARLDLIGMAQSGLDTTMGAQRSAAILSSNLGSASSNARVESLGDMFSDTTGFIRNEREEQGRRRGLGYDLGRDDIYGART